MRRRTARVRTAAVAAVAGALAACAGCASVTTSDAAAAAVAGRFAAAVATGDGDAACALLTPDAVDAIEALRPEGCAAALPTLGLPADPVTGPVEVWGDAAQARSASDAVLLRDGPAGWLVAAAGCEPGETDGAPYECVVDGS